MAVPDPGCGQPPAYEGLPESSPCSTSRYVALCAFALSPAPCAHAGEAEA